MAAGSAEWVEWTESSTGRRYFHNRATNQTSLDPPEGPPVMWVGQLQLGGEHYYWHRQTRECVWDLPPILGEGIGASGRDVDADGVEDAEAQDAWVEVNSNDAVGSKYYWNYHLHVAVDLLPLGVRPTWSAYRTPEGEEFYCPFGRDQDAVWQIPGRELIEMSQDLTDFLATSLGKWIDYGAAVEITGLENEHRRFNNQQGNVIECDGERLHVQLPDVLGGDVLAMRPRHLRPLRPGSIVLLDGLSQAGELNGVSGTITSLDFDAQRYAVRLFDGSVKTVRPTKVRARSRLWEITMNPGHTDLRWSMEQKCLFIDSQGYHRYYALHLPIDFDKRSVGGVYGLEPKSWPLLVYMHGTGGGSFFTYSKKSLRTPGMQFAAHEFVVISPSCEWTWRGSPSYWFIELIHAMLPAEWIDHRRVYLTGCSMGGMGTWEVAACAPELFAAIAPVAAHHKPEKRLAIASKLQQKPVFVLHSEVDDTCPKRKEEPLWEQFVGCGAFKLLILPNVDHCRINEDAYCKNTDLYDWFLRHTLP